MRNAIHSHLIDRMGDTWFENAALKNTLDERRYHDLTYLLAKERTRHGDKLTCHHIVSELSFGFWQHLLTKRFGRIIWGLGVKCAFPNLPNSLDGQNVHDRIEIVRKWRNRIAHHKPISDRKPSARYQDVLQRVRSVCHDIANWVTAPSNVTVAIQMRPAINSN